MIVQRLFSIQSGGPDVGGSLKRELAARAKVGAVSGGITGGIYGTIAGLGVGLDPLGSAAKGLKVGAAITAGSAVLGAMVGALTALGANSRRAKAEGLDMNSLLDYLYNVDDYNSASGFKAFEDVKIDRYIVEDGDPNKFMVNFAYEDGKLVINLNNPSDKLIRELNEELEGIVKFNRKADYAAQSVDNGFMVYVVCPSIDSAAGIIYDIIAENKIKVNALTEKSFSKIKSKNFSEEPEQKEFASIRSMKKQSKALIDAASKKDIKDAGKIAARMNKQGLGKNSEKFLASEGSKKVYKGQVNKLAEIGGTKPSKAMKNLAVEELTAGAVNIGKQNIARGGKAIRTYSINNEPEQKEFNSKAQKLLRRASDYKKAMTGSGRLVSGEASQINKGMNSFGNPGNSFIKQGREMNKSLMSRKKDINTKINQKAGITSAV